MSLLSGTSWPRRTRLPRSVCPGNARNSVPPVTAPRNRRDAPRQSHGGPLSQGWHTIPPRPVMADRSEWHADGRPTTGPHTWGPTLATAQAAAKKSCRYRVLAACDQGSAVGGNRPWPRADQESAQRASDGQRCLRSISAAASAARITRRTLPPARSAQSSSLQPRPSSSANSAG